MAVSALGPALLSLTAFSQEAPKPVPGLEKIKHIIVIYLENRSFDHLYGFFPGANGIKDAGVAATQVDRDGAPYERLPAVMNTKFNPPIPDTRFPFDLPNGLSPPSVLLTSTRSQAIPSITSIRSNCRSTTARWTNSSPGRTRAPW
jgi:phospholipase C